MPDRSADWFRQAEWDLAHAEDAQRLGHHDWACFAAQQAGEMAVRAVHYRLKQEVRGHRIASLLERLATDMNVPPELIEKGRVLDMYYVAPRYANGHDEGAPFEHYGPLQSQQAIAYAREILEFGRLQMAE